MYLVYDLKLGLSSSLPSFVKIPKSYPEVRTRTLRPSGPYGGDYEEPYRILLRMMGSGGPAVDSYPIHHMILMPLSIQP